MALALGAGATPTELARCSRGAVLQHREQRPFVLLGEAQRRRPVAVPNWCLGLLRDGASAAWWRDPDAPLVGMTPEELQRALRAAVSDARLEVGSVTLTRLRAVWQGVLGLQDAPRAVLRGRWALPPALRKRSPSQWPERHRLLYAASLDPADRWRVLTQPPGAWPERVLKRPSGRTRPWQPESSTGGRAPRPLPPSVR